MKYISKKVAAYGQFVLVCSKFQIMCVHLNSLKVLFRKNLSPPVQIPVSAPDLYVFRNIYCEPYFDAPPPTKPNPCANLFGHAIKYTNEMCIINLGQICLVGFRVRFGIKCLSQKLALKGPQP